MENEKLQKYNKYCVCDKSYDLTEKNKLGRTSIEYTVRVYKKSIETGERVLANSAMSLMLESILFPVTKI